MSPEDAAGFASDVLLPVSGAADAADSVFDAPPDSVFEHPVKETANMAPANVPTTIFCNKFLFFIRIPSFHRFYMNFIVTLNYDKASGASTLIILFFLALLLTTA